VQVPGGNASRTVTDAINGHEDVRHRRERSHRPAHLASEDRIWQAIVRAGLRAVDWDGDAAIEAHALSD
jgi:hypothetical protein